MKIKQRTLKQRQSWYWNEIFPLLPIIWHSAADRHNPVRSWSFKWLFVTLWSLDSPSFELSLVCSAHWGIGLIGIAPYLRWSITIPCPERVAFWYYDKTGPKPLVQRLHKTLKGNYE